jgi:hypothetical protein
MTGLGQVRQLARRIDAATPPRRDRAVDALRALAIAGDIGGHWLVTALVLGGSHHGAVLHDDSPLASMPALTPLSWILQTLAVFFLVGGYSAAHGYRGGYLNWLRKRLIRLARPVAALVAVWIPVTVGMCLSGVPAATVHTIVFLVISPLWFLGVYAVLTALTRAAMWLVRRFGAWAAAFPAAVVAVADLVRFGLSGPAWVGWAGIALVNLSAMTLFLWHQTAFITVSSVGLLAGRVPGLLTAPTGGLWVAERLAWLPVFAIMLSGLWLVFRRVERG